MANETKVPEEKYFMDSGDEIRRLTINHALFRANMPSLVLAPLNLTTPRSLRILDSASANGHWLSELCKSLPAELSKQSHFTGADIMPVYFPTNPAPNFTFIEQDNTKPWPANLASSFDLVHQRLGILSAGPKIADVVTGLCNLVRPGGYIQMMEMVPDSDAYASNGPALNQFMALLSTMGKTFGLPERYCQDGLRKWMGEAGIVDVKVENLICQCGKGVNVPGISEEDVIWSMATGTAAIAGYAKALPKLPDGMSPADLEDLPQRMAAELRVRSGVLDMIVVYGRRPS